MLWMLLMRSQACRLCYVRKRLIPKYRPFLACFSTADSQPDKENQRTVETLYKLSVDVRKIRRLKGGVLLEDDTYVEEIVKILRELGADGPVIASILERCPEAIVCSPTAVHTQKELWQSVCKSEGELVKLIGQFPEAFFTVTDQETQKLNVQFFQELGLKNVIISRFLTTAPNIFHNPVETNQRVIKMLQESYRNLGGSEANMKVWLLKLLSQNPFILLNSSASVKETMGFLQELGFTNLDILQLLSKLKGFLFQLGPKSIQNSISFCKNVLKCTDDGLKELVLKCPALLYYPVPVLEERIEGLLKEGISIPQVRDAPMVLELTPQIVEYRMRKLSSLGYSIKDGHLANLSGTKKEFEANFSKIQDKKGRPVFNPVAPLSVDE
ncbi:PREDICTED: mTERF domain-containing protein 3, mitochondrial [Chrysochloris asiatica]|uniref:mTERF domain-containing protein 3, mitochondrial n=1 Tax=Chrysochloris asiatica TaxID=185453 RepID=A0A9B0TH49_CHRAS|nr:PREDICTED: mTERF domain-containing protein 3, mitochondrial [Chrysochloris asiatica]